MDAKLDVMSGQLTDVATEVAHVAQNQRSMMGQLDWLVRLSASQQHLLCTLDTAGTQVRVQEGLLGTSYQSALPLAKGFVLQVYYL